MAKKKPSGSIADSWKRIEDWLAENAKPLKSCLLKGATTAQIKKLEKAVGTALPDAFKQSLRLHNGQKEYTDFIPDDGIGSFYFLSCDESQSDWETWNAVQSCGDFDDAKAKPDKGIAKSWWNRSWIPFASNSGDYLCIDLAPARGGKVGQIILVRHDDPRRKVVAGGLDEWLHNLADTMESGGIDYLLEG